MTIDAGKLEGVDHSMWLMAASMVSEGRLGDFSQLVRSLGKPVGVGAATTPQRKSHFETCTAAVERWVEVEKARRRGCDMDWHDACA
eukprot:2488556-Alexandrium_andersonii.AAC.1